MVTMTRFDFAMPATSTVPPASMTSKPVNAADYGPTLLIELRPRATLLAPGTRIEIRQRAPYHRA